MGRWSRLRAARYRRGRQSRRSVSGAGQLRPQRPRVLTAGTPVSAAVHRVSTGGNTGSGVRLGRRTLG
eukprot:375241-Rhodomonas_salina.1